MPRLLSYSTFLTVITIQSALYIIRYAVPERRSVPEGMPEYAEYGEISFKKPLMVSSEIKDEDLLTRNIINSADTVIAAAESLRREKELTASPVAT